MGGAGGGVSDNKRWHDQWIATDPDRFEGRPYVRDTHWTVAEIQEVWRKAGIYAAQIRAAFPDLTEAQLGAAVTWAPEAVVDQSFVAEWEGPPRRKLYLRHERNALDDERQFAGWMFEVRDFDEAGEEQPRWDNWEESLREILRYPELYAPRDLIWRDETTDAIVDVYGLNES
jgi:uncharacterized protein (DUF433 family)